MHHNPIWRDFEALTMSLVVPIVESEGLGNLLMVQEVVMSSTREWERARDASGGDWLTARDAAAYMRCGLKLVYAAIAKKDLKAARIGGRRALRIHRTWIEDYLQGRADR